jgi:hypothetical protein
MLAKGWGPWIALALAGCLDPQPGDPCAAQEDCGDALWCEVADADAGEGVCAEPEASVDAARGEVGGAASNLDGSSKDAAY